jgi:hypothetical protein
MFFSSFGRIFENTIRRFGDFYHKHLLSYCPTDIEDELCGFYRKGKLFYLCRHPKVEELFLDEYFISSTTPLCYYRFICKFREPRKLEYNIILDIS